jgi:cytidylate kinase
MNPSREVMLLSILTISRQMGSLGDEVAGALSRKLGWDLITRETLINRFFKDIASPYELHMLTESARFYLSQTSGDMTFIEFLIHELDELAEKQSAILVGFGSQVIFSEDKAALHIRIIAPQDARIARIKRQYHVTDDAAAMILSTADKKHKRFVSTIYGVDLADLSLYHLTLNTAMLTVDECVSILSALIKEHEQRCEAEKQATGSEIISHASDRPVFKNPAESEFAKILDRYQIEWKYEPKTFPIEWDAEGNITHAFSPDFYLTKFDTYIELTTMNQKYVTTKNKKLKKMRELYPGINIKIVYKKDFHSLAERFNLIKGE